MRLPFEGAQNNKGAVSHCSDYRAEDDRNYVNTLTYPHILTYVSQQYLESNTIMDMKKAPHPNLFKTI